MRTSELKQQCKKIKSLASDQEIVSEFLGWSEMLSSEDFIKSFRNRALLYHPDKYQSTEDKTIANEIFSLLSSAKDRFFKKYISQRGSSAPNSTGQSSSARETYNGLKRKIQLLHEPLRSELLSRLYWVSSVTDHVPYAEFIELPVDIRQAMSCGLGASCIIELAKVGISWSMIKRTIPNEKILYLLKNNGQSMARLVNSANIPLLTLLHIEERQLSKLQIWAHSVSYLLTSKKASLNGLLSLDSNILGEVLKTIFDVLHRKKDAEKDSYLKKLLAYQYNFLNFSLDLNQLLEVKPLTLRDELLCHLYVLPVLIDRLCIPISELICLENSERLLLYKKSDYLDKLFIHSDIGWSDIKALTTSELRQSIIKFSDRLTVLLDRTDISWQAVISIDDPLVMNFLLEYAVMLSHCVGHNRMSLAELITEIKVNISDENPLLVKIKLIYQELLKLPRGPLWNELLEILYFLFPFQGELANLHAALSPLNVTERQKIYDHLNVIESLVKNDAVSYSEIAILAKMDSSVIQQLNNPICNSALLNRMIRLSDIRFWTTDQFTEAIKNNFSTGYQLSVTALIEKKIQEAIKDAKNRGYTDEEVAKKYPQLLSN